MEVTTEQKLDEITEKFCKLQEIITDYPKLIEENKKLKALVLAQQWTIEKFKPAPVKACSGWYAGGTKNCTHDPEWIFQYKYYCKRCIRIHLHIGRNLSEIQGTITIIKRGAERI